MGGLCSSGVSISKQETREYEEWNQLQVSAAPTPAINPYLHPYERDALLEKNDIQHITETTAIVEETTATAAATTNTVKVGEKIGSCEVCWDHNVALIALPKGCQHEPKYCQKCIKQHIEEQITGKGTPSITCLEPDCNAPIAYEEFCQFIDERPREIMDRLLLHQTLENDDEFRWCANPNGCGSGQFVANGRNLTGYYSCGACSVAMCFKHRIVWHKGMDCNEFDTFTEFDENFSSEMAMLRNTKRCPECRSPIEKLEGCSVMTCCRYGTHGCQENKKRFGKCEHGGKPFCGHRFCWECLGPIALRKSGGYLRDCKPNCRFHT